MDILAPQLIWMKKGLPQPPRVEPEPEVLTKGRRGQSENRPTLGVARQYVGVEIFIYLYLGR
jgi:hypothetical protein